MSQELLNAKLEELGKTIKTMQDSNDQRLKQLETKGHADPLLVDKVEKSNSAITELQGQIKTLSAQLGRKPSVDVDEKSEVKKLHRKTYDRWLRKGRKVENDLAELQLKALEVAGDSTGGFAVPEELDLAIRERATNASPMRQVCTVITAGVGYEQLADLGGTTSGWVDENDARSETNTPALGSVKPSFGAVYAMPGAYQHALDDMGFDAEAWLARSVGKRFAAEENTAFTSGNGTKKAKGILGYTLAATSDASRAFGTIEQILSGTDNVFVPNTLIDIVHALHAQYRSGAKWMTSNLGLAAIRKLKDDNGNYLWRAGLEEGRPDTLLGYGIVENEDVPAPAADANALLFGNFAEAYLIVDVVGVRVIRDDVTSKGKVLFYSEKRVGGCVQNDQAVKVYTLSAPA